MLIHWLTIKDKTDEKTKQMKIYCPLLVHGDQKREILEHVSRQFVFDLKIEKD